MQTQTHQISPSFRDVSHSVCHLFLLPIFCKQCNENRFTVFLFYSNLIFIKQPADDTECNSFLSLGLSFLGSSLSIYTLIPSNRSPKTNKLVGKKMKHLWSSECLYMQQTHLRLTYKSRNTFSLLRICSMSILYITHIVLHR